MTKVSREAVRARLIEGDVHFVRWALAGMFDDGGIFEIKTYAADGTELYDALSYADSLSSLDNELLDLGESIMAAESGGFFNTGPGSYAWIVWDVQADVFKIDVGLNHHGLDGESLELSKYEYIEISATDDQNNDGNTSDRLIVVAHIGGHSAEIRIDEMDPAFNFLMCKTKSRILGRGKHPRTEEELWCDIDMNRLNDFLEQAGGKRQSKIYYYIGGEHGFSTSEDDYIKNPIFSFRVPDLESVFLFTGGWSPDFDYDVRDESTVRAANPDPRKLLHQSGSGTKKE